MKRQQTNLGAQFIEARVVSVYQENGYFVALPVNEQTDETITCNLQEWKDEAGPQPNQIVRLHGVRKFIKGWRATSASPVVYGGEYA